MECSLLTSDPVANQAFFKKQDLDTEEWDALKPYKSFEGDEEDFKNRFCAKDEWNMDECTIDNLLI